MGRTGDSLDDKFPPQSGGRSPLREELLVGRKRGGPWVRWLLLLLLLLLLLNLIISLKIIIVEPGGPRTAIFAWDLCTFHQLLMKILVQERDVASVVFCCRDPFFMVLV